ncbi:hypothetical protein SDC9_200214 [bioreactor metagenome]|uniref:Uncharacterized protein n=1 Tax=bioreactor metagenome TaxID=1076179 RepID=A0A645INW8_9ZZZZ
MAALCVLVFGFYFADVHHAAAATRLPHHKPEQPADQHHAQQRGDHGEPCGIILLWQNVVQHRGIRVRGIVFVHIRQHLIDKQVGIRHLVGQLLVLVLRLRLCAGVTVRRGGGRRLQRTQAT